MSPLLECQNIDLSHQSKWNVAECLWFNVGTTMLILQGEMTHFTVVMDYHFNIICSLNSVYVSFGRWNFDVHYVWFRG